MTGIAKESDRRGRLLFSLFSVQEKDLTSSDKWEECDKCNGVIRSPQINARALSQVTDQVLLVNNGRSARFLLFFFAP